MRRTLLAAALVALALVGTPAAVRAQGLSYTTAPDPIVLFKRKGKRLNTVRITVSGLAGKGAVRLDANIGKVESMEEKEGKLHLRYRLPPEPFPQMLCLLLWRQGEMEARVLRVPLLGRTRVPIRTRPRSEIKVVVGRMGYGPISSGRRGRVRVRIQVPPGVREVKVEVTDRKGLQTTKMVAIEPPAYNRLAMALIKGPAGAGGPAFQAFLAAAEDQTTPPRVVVYREGEEVGQARPLGVQALPGGRFAATWAPGSSPTPGRWILRAEVFGRHPSSREGVVEVRPSGQVARVETRPKEPIRPIAGKPSRFQLKVGIGVGLLHNMGALASPRFILDVGVDIALPLGRLGLMGFGGVSWASQEIEPDSSSGASGLAAAESTVLLLPFGIGLTYRIPLSLVSPYAAVSFIAEVVRTKNQADYASERLRYDMSLGLLAQAGADLALGPGGVFLQAGYQYGELDNEDVELTAGGLVVEAGYRFIF